VLSRQRIFKQFLKTVVFDENSGFPSLFACVYTLGEVFVADDIRNVKMILIRMNTEEKIPPNIVTLAKLFRFVGWWFLVLSSIVCIYQIAILFDAKATIRVNGVPTNDFVTKLAFAAFFLIFPVLGGFCAFTSKKKMQGLLAAFDRWAKAYVLQRLNRK
jgi:hypothetical protein